METEEWEVTRNIEVNFFYRTKLSMRTYWKEPTLNKHGFGLILEVDRST